MPTSDGIVATYRRRDIVQTHNPFTSNPEFQQRVYALARMVADENKCKSVLDVGCGSGHKLIDHLERRGREITGIDVASVVASLRQRWPQHKWVTDNDAGLARSKYDLVICADMIEHVPNPRAWRQRLVNWCEGWLVISTPARERLPGGSVNGPPVDPRHAREWTMAEFAAWIGEAFDVVIHDLIQPEHGTQVIVGRAR